MYPIISVITKKLRISDWGLEMTSLNPKSTVRDYP